MEIFQYYTPTKVVFGRGTEDQTGVLVKAQGCRKVLVHYGSGSKELDIREVWKNDGHVKCAERGRYHNGKDKTYCDTKQRGNVFLCV